jgi:amino acid adenylation domain-containing protein
VALLGRAVQEVVARHEVLRTSFHLDGYSQPLQLVHREAEIPLEVEDLSELSLPEQEETLGRWMEEEKGRSFDVTQPGLLRFQVHKRSEEGFQFSKTEHHVILDGWSEALLLTELFTCYFALLEGQELADQEVEGKEEAGSKFNEFIRLEQETLESEEARRFWERQLAEVKIARMPWRSGSKAAGTTGAKETVGAVQTCSLEVEIGEELSAELKSVARSVGVSIKSVLLAAHVRVMSLLSGEREVVTGLVSNGRAESSGGERVLGVFLNTLPLRVELAGGRWMDLVEQTAAAEKAMLPYRRYPLLDMQRMAGGMELFDVAFNFIHFHVYRELERDFSSKISDDQRFGQTNFALVADFIQNTFLSKLELWLNYNSAQIDLEQAASIGCYYLNALRAIARCPQDRYDIAPLLEEQERRQILTAWNHTSRAVPTVCLPQLLEAQAEATPHATAVIFGEQSLTYRQLHEQANSVAHHLLGLGVAPETRVGIALERSLEMVVALLGTLKAGAAYLPLDLDYPQARLEQMLADAEPAIVISLQSHRHRLPDSTSVLALDEDEVETQKLLAQAAVSHPQDRQRSCSLQPLHPAYVIYTSGSTGTPKGAVVSHEGIVNRLLWMQAEYGLQAEDRVLQKTPFSFDVSVWEFFWPLLAGATLVMAEPGGHRDPAYLASLIQQAGVTTVHFVPSMLEAFIQEPKAAGCRGLRRVICSGEALSAELQAEFYRILPVPLHNLYGPTEASVDVSYWACPVNAGAGLVPIGRPIWNTQLYVLDESLQAVPVGVVGELYIGGTGLGRGYLKRAGLTAQRFVGDPYSQAGARMYRTGDVARWRTDGVLEFLGRNDHQVKVRGFRIELEEIESALRASGEVAQAVVIASGERLVGYVVGVPGRVVEAEQLQQRLRQKLPEYMVPAAVVVLESLPLTANGKLDRKALPQPKMGGGQQWRGPSTPQEEELCAIFGEVLGVERVSVDASFFALGGHSLLAMRLVRMIESRLSWKLTLRNIFDSPTVAQLAQAPALGPSAKSSFARLLPLRAQGNLPPLFCLPGAGGLSWSYAGLTREISAERPIYGLQASGIEAETLLPREMETIVDEYIEAVREVQAAGPYHLLGWSFGGLVAHAVACRLQEEQEEVGLLALLDSYPRLEDELPVFNDYDDLREFAALFGIKPDHFQDRAMDIATLIQVARDEKHLLGSLKVELVERMMRVFKNNVLLAYGFRPGRFSGDMLFFAATEHQHLSGAPLAWSKHVSGEIEVHPINCSHAQMTVPPNLAAIGKILEWHLHGRRSLNLAFANHSQIGSILRKEHYDQSI